jgi:glycosyltransferase involved in cell wall biosynthesis
MKIVVFIYSMHSGGAERVSVNLANAWAELGHEVTLLTLASASLDFYELRPEVKRIALHLAANSKGPVAALWANLRRIHALRRVFREIQPDVVLAMMTTAAVLAVLATRGMECQVLVSERIHPPLYPVGRMWDWLRCQTYPFAYRVVMQAEEGLVWLHDRIPSAKGVVIPNPVAFPLAVTSPQLLPTKYLSAKRNLLLAVGRLDRQKGFDTLIEAFAVIESTYPQWDLIILGEGQERSALETKVRLLGLKDRVLLPGRAGNVGDWYTRAGLYVMSSRFEGFPNTLAEAMAHGCAAISYDCDTGPRDIIHHEIDGLLVTPVGDVQALSQALDRLMGNDAVRQQMGKRATSVRVNYSIQRILEMWSKLLLNSK